MSGSLITNTVKLLTHLVCRVDDAQIAKLPPRGPLLLVFNHINFLDSPVLYSHAGARPVTSLSKVENWQHPIVGPLFTYWGLIPIHRGEVDREALRAGLQALKDEKILAIAPEGTRSHDGKLQRGQPGTVMLALLSGAPIWPLVHYGSEAFPRNIKRLRRTDFHIIVGEPFTLDSHGQRARREMRRQMTDEMMYQLAALLPPAYRGVYADLDAATEEYLHFDDPTKSNLRRALLAEK